MEHVQTRLPTAAAELPHKVLGFRILPARTSCLDLCAFQALLCTAMSTLCPGIGQFESGCIHISAHSASLKLQRHALTTSNSHERLIQLEREDALLKSELSILRVNPHSDTSESHPATEVEAVAKEVIGQIVAHRRCST
ncbi:hypothetical protein EDD85DRAFT_279894 [Armillaria nabsnona]|nr:hypothetical protein EDD85DRAFT_279894 [Armillaria nabsnona]